ncbi:MAG: AbrB/MazE/SpoVT family DNA-binding domain-containing protein [Anaerolineales bacterium]|nr:AbrB/MazE/SpoVT family DNA-binding domain-containing protein [Anaerolineales bacterium]
MTTVQMRGKGTITFPAKLRKKYNLEDGEVMTIIDLGGGSFLLKPMVSRVSMLADRIAKRLKEDNVTLDDLLQTLDEERKKYYQEHYAKK